MDSPVLTTSDSKVYVTVAFIAAAVLALAIGRDLLHMPLQIGDSLAPILDAVRSPSAWHEFTGHLTDTGYFRPMRYATIKIVSDLGNGNYFLAYRLFHAILVVAFLGLFVGALRVRDRLSLVALPLALTVFVGIHTFLGTVKEQYPIPHFLEVAVFALVALNLAQSRGGVRVDLALLLTLAVAALTLETGLLVWVVVVGAWLAGMSGVSKRTVIITSAVLIGYVWMRFLQNSVGVPTIDERSTGFLLETIDAPEIRERFGNNLAPFYVYNVLSSLSSLLFAEPRSGVWVSVRAFLSDDGLAPVNFINIGASLFGTGLIAAYVIDRWRSGVRRPVTLADQQVVVGVAVLLASAAMSHVYTKDEILSAAGAFYALLVFGATVHLLRGWSTRRRSWLATAALCVLFIAGSAAWATRAAGVHHVLRAQAFVQRNDWTRLEREWRRDGNWDEYSDVRPLIRRLQSEAISMRVVNPRFVPRWMERVFDRYY